MKRIVYLFGLAVTALAFAAPAMAETYVVSRRVWSYYQEYLRDIGSTRAGAFAITKDGTGAYYVYCPGQHCIAGTTYRHKAIQSCQREYGTDCVAFADRDDILISYTLSEAQASAPATAPAFEPAPVTRINLSAAAQAEVERYLANSKSTSKAWALAITKDGAKAVSADCPATGGGGYFSGGGAGAGCNLNEGTAQELATKKALRNCGGADDCVLLYRGQQKVANIDIAAN